MMQAQTTSSQQQQNQPAAGSQTRRRNRPGTKASDLWGWGMEDISKMNGPFAVQEYLQELIRNEPANVMKICELPPEVDESVWQYEHIRQFILELNLLVVQLLGICTSKSCPKMTGNKEFIFICAAHKSTTQCSAIDYMIHTLDNATALVHSSNFNRVAIPPDSKKHLHNIVRRLYRLFAHTYFHHGDIFEEFENEMHLCARFTHFSKKFKMMSADQYMLPEEAIQIRSANNQR